MVERTSKAPVALDPAREQAARRDLKRLLANGPLTAMPTRPPDQALLSVLAASRFEPDREYRESEVNEALKAWLSVFCAPFGIDHVTLRRMLVDARLLSRTRSGSFYRLNREKLGEMYDIRAIDPALVLVEVREEREQRKQRRRASLER